MKEYKKYLIARAYVAEYLEQKAYEMSEAHPENRYVVERINDAYAVNDNRRSYLYGLFEIREPIKSM